MSQTKRAIFSAALKQHPDGSLFIVFETYSKSEAPFDKLIGLDLREHVTAAEAQALIDQMSDAIQSVALTTID